MENLVISKNNVKMRRIKRTVDFDFESIKEDGDSFIVDLAMCASDNAWLIELDVLGIGRNNLSIKCKKYEKIIDI
jgi:hypothetical protein